MKQHTNAPRSTRPTSLALPAATVATSCLLFSSACEFKPFTPIELPPDSAVVLAVDAPEMIYANGTQTVPVRVGIPTRKRQEVTLVTTAGTFSDPARSKTLKLTTIPSADPDSARSFAATSLVVPNSVQPIIVTAAAGKFSVADTIAASVLQRVEPTGLSVSATPFGSTEQGNRVSTVTVSASTTTGTVTVGAAITVDVYPLVRLGSIGDTVRAEVKTDANGKATVSLMVHPDDLAGTDILTIRARRDPSLVTTTQVVFRAGG